MKHLSLVILFTILLSSCSNDDNTTTTPITTANIIGSVNLFDEGTTELSNSGMTVSIEGTSPLISSITDENGDFTLSDVPFGTYTILFEKNGYGTFKKFGVEHNNTGNSTIITDEPSLGQKSTTQITNLTASSNPDDVTITVTTNQSGSGNNSKYVRFFISTDPDLSSSNYSFHSSGLEININPIEITLNNTDFANAGISTGETAYVIFYGDSFWSNEYNDTSLGYKVFPNLNSIASDAVSFVVP